MDKFNIVLNLTTFCNYNCSYCDVVKDKKRLSQKVKKEILNFIATNKNSINGFKFFGGEPLLAFDDIKYIVDNSNNYIGNKFEIVTNTTMLNDQIGDYFRNYFSTIFFSIDTENDFNYDFVFNFINKYNLSSKVYFNLIVSPGTENESLNQFYKILSNGFTNFNILPVYFTKSWTDNNLKSFTNIMKVILNQYLTNKEIVLYGFQQNKGYNSSLINESLFIDVDGLIFYSDIVTTKMGLNIKDNLKIGYISDIIFSKLDLSIFNDFKKYINIVEEYNYINTPGQRKLHKLMDYFSIYLNSKI